MTKAEEIRVLDEALTRLGKLVPDQRVDVQGQLFGISSCREILIAMMAERGLVPTPEKQ